ncbi:MAG TPA: porin [Fibrobacteria bacterium]|nr:porin [Fibrobacteria bacterium]
MKYTVHAILAVTLGLSAAAFAQSDSALKEQVTNLKGQVDGLNESYLETKGTVDKLAKLSFGGYIQAQYQLTGNFGLRDSTSPGDSIIDTTLNGGGSPTVAGGTFPGQSNQRFQIRRARLKATYTGAMSKSVLELDASPSSVSLKDAYVQLNEPWLKTFSLTIGNQDMPFGFEIGYSSSAMEAPERTRLENNIFKGEKQLGAKIEANPTEQMGFLQFLNAKAGLFTGTEGGASGTGDEVDRGLEFIGRAGFKAPFNDLGLAIDGGVSFLYGKLQAGSDSVFTMSGDTSFIPDVGNKPKRGEWKYYERKITGVDLQVYYTIPVIGDMIGGSSLRGEYVQGTQPGTSGSVNTYTNAGATATANASAGNMYIRKFSGWYLQFVQNVGNSLQGSVRYDVYDPNTDASDGVIRRTVAGAGGRKGLNETDLSYKTLGFGLTYFWDANLKFVAYYDMPMNAEEFSPASTAKGSFKPYREDVEDNVLTLRAQLKF